MRLGTTVQGEPKDTMIVILTIYPALQKYIVLIQRQFGAQKAMHDLAQLLC